MKHKISFEEWMKLVDRQVEAQTGMSVHDLEDCSFRDWYDENVSSARAVRLAMENAGACC